MPGELDGFVPDAQLLVFAQPTRVAGVGLVHALQQRLVLAVGLRLVLAAELRLSACSSEHRRRTVASAWADQFRLVGFAKSVFFE